MIAATTDDTEVQKLTLGQHALASLVVGPPQIGIILNGLGVG